MWTFWLVTAQVELITLRKHTHLMGLFILNEVNNYTCVFFLLWHVEITCQTSVSVPASPRYTLAWVSIHFTFLFIWSSVFEGGSETMLRKRVYKTTRTKLFHFHSSSYTLQLQISPQASFTVSQLSADIAFFNGKVFAPTKRGEGVNALCSLNGSLLSRQLPT